VLPTDDRFKELSETQKNLLFVGYLEHPLSEDMHRGYQKQDDAITEETETDFAKLGYLPEQIAHIKEQVEAAKNG